MIEDTPNARHEPEDAAHLEQVASAAAEPDTSENAVPIRPAPEPVHRWLDGESVAEADLHAPEAEKHVRFWARVNEETGRRHRQKTPRGLDAIIMGRLEPPVVKDD